MRWYIGFFLLFYYCNIQAQDLTKFPPNYSQITVDSFCDLYPADFVDSIAPSGVYEFDTHTYANRLLIARLWNTVLNHTEFVKNKDHFICPQFSMNDGTWFRFYEYVEHSWGGDSMYFKNGEMYILDEQGEEEFAYYRLKKSRAALKAEEKAAQKEEENRAYRKDKILTLPKERLPEITTDLLQEWLLAFFEKSKQIEFLEIQDFETKKIEKINLARLLERLQQMKKGEQLIIRYLVASEFDVETFRQEQVGPIIFEVKP